MPTSDPGRSSPLKVRRVLDCSLSYDAVGLERRVAATVCNVPFCAGGPPTDITQAVNRYVTTRSMILRRTPCKHLFIPSSLSLQSLPRRGAFTIALSLVAVLALGACAQNNDGKTVGQKVDSALEHIKKATAETKVGTESAVVNGPATMKDATQKAASAGKYIANRVEEKFADLDIKTAVHLKLVKNIDLSALKVNADTRNGAVLVRNTSPTLPTKEQASDITKVVQGFAR